MLPIHKQLLSLSRLLQSVPSPVLTGVVEPSQQSPEMRTITLPHSCKCQGQPPCPGSVDHSPCTPWEITTWLLPRPPVPPIPWCPLLPGHMAKPLVPCPCSGVRHGMIVNVSGRHVSELPKTSHRAIHAVCCLAKSKMWRTRQRTRRP